LIFLASTRSISPLVVAVLASMQRFESLGASS
jgi:hypothetical protein